MSACSGGQEAVTVTSVVTSEVTEAPASVPDAQLLLDATVAHVESIYGGQLGIATVGNEGPVADGFTAPSPAWSTIKVPIAIAAMRTVPGLEEDARAAVSASDNGAAQRLFDAVGPDAVDAVLAEAGLDARVNTEPLRPEFSTYGQTQLSVADEAVLAGQVACVDGAGPVLALMGQLDPSQAYGLGTIGALFKGGWGPDTTGAYQVRQFGLVPRGDGAWAPVAITALPADGTYETGQAMLTAAAEKLAAEAARLPAAACQP
ncbi:hypothetical protein HMPREF3151_02125 [Corynebacterium sp. HMSC05H05]|nr:hypothetical protein HMPREF3151_02125 [Corynebacterium sp. HMSC05H05]